MMSKPVRRWMLVVMVGALALAAPSLAQAKSAKLLTVCKHGCVYTTIQSAVNHSGRGATINVKPGKYVEGVIVSGHPHDGLHIIGLGKQPRRGTAARARTPTARRAPPRTGSRATTSTTSCWRT